MNKVLSQAIKRAVSEFSPTKAENHLEKRPDLFSLNNDTEIILEYKPQCGVVHIWYGGTNLGFPENRFTLATGRVGRSSNSGL